MIRCLQRAQRRRVSSARFRWLASLVLFIVAFGMAMPRMISASTFVLMDERDLTEQSVAAAIGLVTSVNAAVEPDGSIYTYVVIEPEDVLFGDVPSNSLVLRERGGLVRGRGERIYGAAEYSVGERVLVFLSQNDDGTLRTTGLSMGKYRLAPDSRGVPMAKRDLGEGVALLDPRARTLRERPRVRRKRLSHLLRRMREVRPRRPRRPPRNAPVPTAPASVPSAPASFTFLAQPARWFEPDYGQGVDFLLDLHGDAKLGLGLTRSVVNDALAAWSSIPTSSLLLADGGLTDAVPFSGCDGPNRVVFNDPFDEVVDPTDCRGVLAIGGFCFDDQETRTLGDTTFRRIKLGKVTFADGWSDCDLWTPCNVAEVATHELGHAVGFGHSADQTATLAPVAHFDGRCAGLASDDMEAASFAYPIGLGTPTQTAIPTASGTPTITSTRTARPTRTMQLTPTQTPPPTPTATQTVRPSTPTATRTYGRTPTVSVTFPVPDRIGVSGKVRYYASSQPVGDVTVDLAGRQWDTTQTRSNGEYVFSPIEGGVRTLRPRKVGGFASGLSALDAAYVLQMVLGRRTFDPVQDLACDVTGNGNVSPLDAAWILQLSADAAGRFPVGEACGSDWAFLPAPEAVENQTSIPPLTSATPCRPGTIALAPLAGDVTGQDFLAVLFGDCTGNWQSDEVGVIQETLPPGSGLELQPMRRARGGRVRLPIGVRTSGPFFGLDVQLRYDPTELEARSVRPVPSEGPMLRYSATPGRLAISLASADALQGNGDVLLVVEFQDLNVDEALPEVVVSSAAIDEQLLPRR